MRKKIPIIDFEGFCNQLMSRLYPVIKWNVGISDDILILMNVLDRSPVGVESGEMIYGGMLEQKRLLPNDETLDSMGAWEKLSGFRLKKGKVAESLYQPFQEGELDLNDIQIGELSTYFNGSSDLELKEAVALEEDIVSKYFNINKDYYLSLPVIQFGEFDGVVHIIFSSSQYEKFDQKAIISIIRLISMEFENLLLDWDLVDENIERDSILASVIDYLNDQEYARNVAGNPIIKELNYRQYYEESLPYFLKRRDQNEAVPDRIKDELRKRAIISILIDSYAHNISAHSLTVLKWWFHQRASSKVKLLHAVKEITEDTSFNIWMDSLKGYLGARFPSSHSSEEIEKGILYDLARWIDIVDRRLEKGDYLPIRDQFLPLAEQLYPFFKFLLEKGAFWSGITRDQQFGGEIKNLYDVLWRDFIDNPLYLGTIAYSEGITRLNIHLRFYQGDNSNFQKDEFRRDYFVEKTIDGQLISGLFASVNVGGVVNKNFSHRYIDKSKNFETLAKRLTACKVYFPGGVVGKHAFFTLIENEIRNVKHFPEKELMKMRDNGLDLYIGIRPSRLATNEKEIKLLPDRQLYRIGVWLGHLSKLQEKRDNLVVKRLEQLKKDIIDPVTNQARLGGNYQDKICSAMLFNNNFISVERKLTVRDKKYYPWVRSAYGVGLDCEGEREVDYEVKNSNLEKARADFNRINGHPDQGYFKKYFYMWKGENIFHLKNEDVLDEENIARFKIVVIDSTALKSRVRAAGVIRVLKQGSDNEINNNKAYYLWLKEWLKEKQCHIRIMQGGETTIGHFIFDNKVTQYYSEDDYFNLDEDAQDIYASDLYYQKELHFAHGDIAFNSRSLSIRSHGILSNYFFENLLSINDFDMATISPQRTYELLETIQTRICIFDKRIAERVKEETQRNRLELNLNCELYWEDASKWEELKQQGVQNYHFIVLHLSFIEALTDKHGKRYSEERIVEFLDEQIGDQLSDNCIFVVTTGRGRAKWWEEIKNSKYASFTTFRPVEMLIEAVESACMKNDDVELKYNLVKVLFGS